MGRTLNSIAACGLALCLSASAVAQNTVSSADLSKVRETNREQLHPGEALKIRGIAQGANDFLANTPALRGGPTNVELVAAEDARERRLAMYEGGQRFDSAPRSSSRMSASDPGIPTAGEAADVPGSSPPEEKQDDDAPNRYLLPAAFVGLVIYTLKKFTS